jgi:hypothetical protein
MEHGKPLQEGVRVKLPPGVTWQQLAAMSPEDIRERDLWPKGFLPLPHPFQPTGGQVFPKDGPRRIDEITSTKLTESGQNTCSCAEQKLRRRETAFSTVVPRPG